MTKDLSVAEAAGVVRQAVAFLGPLGNLAEALDLAARSENQIRAAEGNLARLTGEVDAMGKRHAAARADQVQLEADLAAARAGLVMVQKTIDEAVREREAVLSKVKVLRAESVSLAARLDQARSNL
jgi:hypothetical protein